MCSHATVECERIDWSVGTFLLSCNCHLFRETPFCTPTKQSVANNNGWFSTIKIAPTRANTFFTFCHSHTYRSHNFNFRTLIAVFDQLLSNIEQWLRIFLAESHACSWHCSAPFTESRPHLNGPAVASMRRISDIAIAKTLQVVKRQTTAILIGLDPEIWSSAPTLLKKYRFLVSRGWFQHFCRLNTSSPTKSRGVLKWSGPSKGRILPHFS